MIESLRVHFATRAIAHCLAQDYTDVALEPVVHVPATQTDGVRHLGHFTAKFTAVSREDGDKVEGDITYVKSREATYFLTTTQVTPVNKP
jgi:hypothetical protein